MIAVQLKSLKKFRNSDLRPLICICWVHEFPRSTIDCRYIRRLIRRGFNLKHWKTKQNFEFLLQHAPSPELRDELSEAFENTSAALSECDDDDEEAYWPGWGNSRRHDEDDEPGPGGATGGGGGGACCYGYSSSSEKKTSSSSSLTQWFWSHSLLEVVRYMSKAK